LQELINTVSGNASQLGLRINSTKTMATTYSPLHIRCGNEDIEHVVEFGYLGSIVEKTGSTSKEIMTRIGQAIAAFNRLKRIWKLKTYLTRLKLHLFNRNVIPVLLYAAETWSLNQQQKKRIFAFENNCLRRILQTHWSDRITNEKVRKLAN
jgi:hypothetical protein